MIYGISGKGPGTSAVKCARCIEEAGGYPLKVWGWTLPEAWKEENPDGPT